MKDKIINYSDRIITACLYLAFFCIPFAKAGVETFIWVSIFLWLVKRVSGYRTDGRFGLIPSTKLNKALVVFLLINFLAVIFSTNLALSSRGFFGKILKFTVIYFMVVETINTDKRRKSFLLVMILSVVLIILDGMVQYFRGVDFLRGYAYARLRASFPTANTFAAWLTLLIPVFLALSMLVKNNGLINKFKKMILLSIFVILMAYLVLSYSRGAWLGLIFGFSLFGYCAFRADYFKRKRLFILAGLFIILLVLPFGSLHIGTGESIRGRIKSIATVKDQAVLIRLGLWQESLKIIRDYPLIGCGLNNYSVVGPKYKNFNLGGGYPHNSYLQMAAETGLLGLFSFLWVVFIFFKTGLCHFKKTKNYLVLGLLSGILAFLVHAFFDTHLYALQLVISFWFMLGFTVAVIKLDSEKL
ncbi:MAG: O-antigen ligase family protein [Candidatus Omnitrophota bacterium]|jgi:O-antigen ligase